MAEKAVKLEELMKGIENMIIQNPEPIKDVHASYQFQFTDTDAVYQFIINDGTVTLVNGEGKRQADCILTMSTENFEKFLDGKLKGTMAFMTGKLKLKGDITKALQLESLLKEYKS